MNFKDIPQFTTPAYYHVNMPWDHLENALKSYNTFNTLQLDPEFQRAHVWNTQQREKYVEFILRGGQSSKDIYFNQADWMHGFKAPMYLVDGKQRLESVRLFLRDELRVFGYLYSEFTGHLPHNADFIVHVNNLKTYADVLQWYIDLNSGGIAHTQKDIEKVKYLLSKELENNG